MMEIILQTVSSDFYYMQDEPKEGESKPSPPRLQKIDGRNAAMRWLYPARRQTTRLQSEDLASSSKDWVTTGFATSQMVRRQLWL